ncbi:SDR family NAD(P)-dependent oxidoreductase [Limosilactobacillus reuteri]|uniref:SDR family oxidoreductase n=1 Tax=Limosilactobacillus reuteri TaxID=1598 RepID=UPI001E29ED15|nr:SDR family NAD(P)-dependent oxidoreductase [Limosilactobacillus reuteri]MCC4382797.1 SDR family NAD(P)-dependent oxidoreductase [Limosilactobacillus reuteri]MCC4400184.1 SDR family NAD(P)-dependent oxidoreductase [Limosilactobacillus reuteri]MCC4403600.1 SDR family NAD(P)-dependent oxidoreductase [Limosilactobacillus reuteri]MCC4411937.1 SDR family NAD(P)-dependent oxidoreductase [Limosilactobacillus reuteri]MCC4414735.1 SDR family NAD(P)-dependent oxidoreductase [Limosilactobacillus reuter
MENVQNKVVLITGASSGIGGATAKLLANNGAMVALRARREERLGKVVDEIGTDNAVYLKSDVTDLNSLKQLVKLAKEKFGKIDVLFANTGLYAGSQPDNVEISELAVLSNNGHLK